MTHKELELFFCSGNNFKLRWFIAKDVPIELLDEFREEKRDKPGPQLCNTDKSTQYT